MLGAVYKGMVVSEQTVDKIVRMALREVILCKLIGCNGVCIYYYCAHYIYLYI
ncbi:hypothetical protein Sinac_4334 [Singulisphaera acidiphila DSM 18658]|uniref:Uncharacterized protein n=1 Tax=Singulisphaera acidiphila (strain ATCC BAA-1392 / DSM 18658 / VKM B-2454 / MOB10) TaxID=886293 RepID=L0DIQ2_SINAD|nr:hypothetical protein Sinac_4334 [Singulisphaera acidiphila DSM 18658]